MEARAEYQRVQAKRRKHREEKGLGWDPLVTECSVCGLSACRCGTRKLSKGQRRLDV